MSVDGIILAAGLSSRAGAFKMALDIHGKTMIEHTADAMAQVCDRIIVVGGFKVELIRCIFRGRPDVSVVYNKNYRSGMFSSLKTGMRNVKAERFFFTPGDIPMVGGKVYRRLLAAEADVAVPVTGGRKGHPVLINSRFIPDILSNPVYRSMRDFMDTQAAVHVPVDAPGILQDVDTPEDYNHILQTAG